MFDGLHEQTYGYSVLAEPVEIVNIGLTAIGRLDRPRVRHVIESLRSTRSALPPREVHFKELGGPTECRVYDRYLLDQGMPIEGPAIIEEIDSTIVVNPGYAATVAEHGTLVIRPTPAGSE